MTQTDESAATSDEALCTVIARRHESLRAADQARSACGQLYERHARSLLAFLATRAARHELDDFHQVIWQRVWQSVGTSFTGGNFRAWLFQITRNYLIDERRKKRPDQMSDQYEQHDPRATRPDDILLDQERMQTLARCLEKLERDAAALVRARLQGESYDRICEQLNLAADRAHRLFHSAKQRLQTCVGQDEP